VPFTQLTAAKSAMVRRLMLSISGFEKSGKTHFALATAPEPVFHAILDPNGYAIAQKLVRQSAQPGTAALALRDIRPERYKFDPQDTQKECLEVWNQLRADLNAAMRVNKGTIVIDSGTEMWELLRIARLGKTDGTPARYYGPLNAEMRTIFADIADTDMNLIVTHKMKEEYKANNPTGNMIPAGWSDMPYTMGANARALYDPELAKKGEHPFLIYIENCALNYALAGQWYSTDWFTFEQWLEMLES
jgi:hypothetical protein